MKQNYCLSSYNGSFLKKENDLLSLVASKGKLLNFGIGDKIIEQGANCKGIYIITSGVLKATKNLLNNEEFVLWFAGPKEILGLEAFFNNTPFNFSAIPMSVSASVSYVSKDIFQKFLDKNPNLKTELIGVLCDRINFTENRLTSILQKKTKERFAEILRFLSEKWQRHQNSSNVNNVLSINEFSLSDLANLIGTSQGYLKKILPEFQSKGLIQRKGDFIRIKHSKKPSSC